MLKDKKIINKILLLLKHPLFVAIIVSLISGAFGGYITSRYYISNKVCKNNGAQIQNGAGANFYSLDSIFQNNPCNFINNFKKDSNENRKRFSNLREKALDLSKQIKLFSDNNPIPQVPINKSDFEMKKYYEKDVPQFYKKLEEEYNDNFGAKVIAIHDDFLEYGLEDQMLSVYVLKVNGSDVKNVGIRVESLTQRDAW